MTVTGAEVLSLSQYLLKDRVLVVPPWQREYKWGSGDVTNKDQVNRLLEDLDEFVQSPTEQYFMGLLTLTNTDHSIDNRKVNYIVDGQQRTVTMQIFLMCCYEYLSRKNSAMIPVEDANLYSNLEELVSFRSSRGPGGLRVRFDQSGANTILQLIHTWMTSTITDPVEKNKIFENASRGSKTQDNLLEVRRYFTEELESNDESTGRCKWFGGEIDKAIVKIISGLKFIELQISDEQEAMDIYNKMNSRGMGLDSADLIKNQLFAYVNDDRTFDEISDYWNTMSEHLREHKATRLKDPVFLVRSFAGTIWGKPHRDKELAATFGRYLSGKTKPGNEEPSFLSEPLDFVSELRELAQESVYCCSEKTNYPLLLAAQKVGAVQHFPLILAGKYLRNETLRKHFYKQVATRAILQVLSKEHPPHVEHIYPNWAHQIFRNKDTQSVEELDSIYRSFAFKRGEANQAEIDAYRNERASVLDTQISLLNYELSAHRRKIAFILGILSWFLDQKDPAEHTLGLKDYLNLKSVDPATDKVVKWDIDHIAANALDDNVVSQESKQGIGNLVLLNYKKNRSAGSSEPESKKHIYTVRSSLVLTKITDYEILKKYEKDFKKMSSLQVALDSPWDLNNWTETSITNRAAYLRALLKEMLIL